MSYNPNNPFHRRKLAEKILRRFHKQRVANEQQPALEEFQAPAFSVVTRRAAKSGTKTAQWVRQYPSTKTNIFPDSTFRAAGLSH